MCSPRVPTLNPQYSAQLIPVRPQRLRHRDAALAEQLQRLTDEAALNDAVIRLQASELASARVSLTLTFILT